MHLNNEQLTSLVSEISGVKNPRLFPFLEDVKTSSHKAIVLALVFVLPMICSCVSSFMHFDNQQSFFITDVEKNETHDMESEQKEEKDTSEERFALLYVSNSLCNAQFEVLYFTDKNRLSRGCIDTLLDPPESM
ncbi:MAG: hypothetical protein ACI9CU_001285 [Polaribacter sp.]